MTRLISLVLLLQSRECMTASELAAELGVSERTVYRDVLTLADAGVPIYADRGRLGGYRLVSGYRTRLTGLTRTQAEALFLSGVRGPAREMGLTEILDAAQLKVLAALPPGMRDAPATAAQRFHLDAPSWFRQSTPPPLLPELARATWQDRVVNAAYRRREQVVTRTLEPYGLVLKNGVWYLAGHVPGTGATSGLTDRPGAASSSVGASGGAGGERSEGSQRREDSGRELEPFRVYRVDRFTDVEVTETVFDRDETFDLATFWAARAAEFSRRILTATVTVRLSRQGRRLLPHLVDPVAAHDALAGASEPDAEGWVTAQLGVESLDVAYDELFRLGVEVEVLAPPELRARMAQAAERLAARYRI